MINQGRYIINAFLIFFVIFFSIVLFKTILKETNSSTPENFQVIDTIKPSPMAMRGQELFRSTCAACHALDVDLTGPHLRGVLNREPYNGDVKKFLRWVKNTSELVKSDPYYKSLKDRYNGVVMPPLNVQDEDLKAIIEYLNSGLQESRSIAGILTP